MAIGGWRLWAGETGGWQLAAGGWQLAVGDWGWLLSKVSAFAYDLVAGRSIPLANPVGQSGR